LDPAASALIPVLVWRLQIEKALLAKVKAAIEQFYGKMPEEQQKHKVGTRHSFVTRDLFERIR
jgi:hypothetical protein